MKRVLIKDTKGFISPEKVLDFRETGPKTSNKKNSRRRHGLADYVSEMYLSACRTCSTIIFPHSTNHIIDLWRGHMAVVVKESGKNSFRMDLVPKII